MAKQTQRVKSDEVDPDGLDIAPATEGTLALIKAKTDNIPAQGQALAAASTPVVLTAAQEAALTPPAAITGFATSAKQDTLLTELQLKADLTETQPVSAATLPLPSGAATSAKQDTLLTELQLKADLTESQPVTPQQPTGTRADGSVTLTLATTAYQVPTSPPASPYLLVVSANAANTAEMRWLTQTGTTLGHPIAPGATMSIRLPASAALFLYSGTAGQIANHSTLIL